MKENKEPVGISIDPIKEKILIPYTAEIIKDILPAMKDLGIFDYGTGDSSSILYLKELLEGEGFSTQNVILCDSNQSCLGPSHLNVFDDQDRKEQGYSVVEIENYSDDWARLDIIESQSIDVIVAQNSFHQIKNDVEIQSFIARSIRFLKQDGIFVFTDFSPKYLEWIRERYPEKLSNIVEKDGRILSCQYNSNDGSSAVVYNRTLEDIVSKFVFMGLYPVKGMELGVDRVVEKKDRYKRMVEDKIPMFVTVAFRINPEVFISYDEGYVKRVVQGNKYFDLYFSGRDKISIPVYPGCKDIRKGDEIILVQTVQEREESRVPTLVVILFPQGRREGASIQYLRKKL